MKLSLLRRFFKVLLFTSLLLNAYVLQIQKYLLQKGKYLRTKSMCNCAWYKKLIKENCVTKNDFSYEKNVSGTKYRYVRLPAYKKKQYLKIHVRKIQKSVCNYHV